MPKVAAALVASVGNANTEKVASACTAVIKASTGTIGSRRVASVGAVVAVIRRDRSVCWLSLSTVGGNLARQALEVPVAGCKPDKDAQDCRERSAWLIACRQLEKGPIK